MQCESIVLFLALEKIKNMTKHIKINDQIALTEVREGDQTSLVKYLNDDEVAANTLLIPYPYHKIMYVKLKWGKRRFRFDFI